MSNEVQTPASGQPANKRALNEMRRLDPQAGKPSRDIPDDLKPHYHQDGNAFRSAYHQEKIEFVDRGARMHAYFPVSTFTTRAMAHIAESRGWKEMEVTGTEKFRQAAYVEAAARGISVRGYEPSAKDKDILERRHDRKEAEHNPVVQAFLKAETKKDRDAAAKQYPELKAAFAADAAAKAIAEEKIDSKKSAANFVGRFRDSIAIALHTGRALPNVEVQTERKAADKTVNPDQSRTR